jgi:transcriptional regulator with XRE-family HTH domain
MAPRIGRSRLPELLKANRLNQTEFAQLMELSDGFVSQVKSGERYFSYPMAVKACWILKCRLEDLHDIEGLDE